MKTRILSAAVMIVLIGGFLVLGFTVSPLFITAFIAFLTAVAIYELLHNAAGINNKAALTEGIVFSVLMSLFTDKYVLAAIRRCAESDCIKSGRLRFTLNNFASSGIGLVRVGFFLLAAFTILAFHKEFDLAKIFIFVFSPHILSFGFSCMGRLITSKRGLYYLLLLVTYACICDTGAYFTGVFLGKHKLCPEISPKKTVEGAIGGIVSSVIVAVILIVIFKPVYSLSTVKIVSTVILSVPLCIIGMAGDLFASKIKRSVDLKDYGNLIPGHGGILDRFDSMLLIAPALYVLSVFGAV